MKDIMDFLTPAEPDAPGNAEKCLCLNKLPLAYSYTPMQELCDLYDYDEALKNGTVFPELNLPFGVYGNNFCKKEVK